ncbi:MAG: SPOR domain-containing protein [Candidatus Magasanikbacteria bacterium]|nr:SPOR domain-containing protein [Candidatus Magasanikbacteria bacterium]
MRWIFNPPIWLLVPLGLFVTGLFLWVVFPPGPFRHKNVKHEVVEAIVPISIPPPMLHSTPDASEPVDVSTSADISDTVAADAIVAGDGRTSDSSVLVLETVGSPAPQQPTPPVVSSAPSALSPYFLKVKIVFESAEDAADYADDVLAKHGVGECQIGVKGQGANKRFVLLVGPFQTRREAAKVQSRLTAARVRTLFIDQRFLRRFQSIKPVSPRPSVSVRALTFILPAKPCGQAAIFLAAGQFPVLIFCKQWKDKKFPFWGFFVVFVPCHCGARRSPCLCVDANYAKGVV